jgi:competence protein ComEC
VPAPLLFIVGLILGVMTPVRCAAAVALAVAGLSVAIVAGVRLRKILVCTALLAAASTYGATARDRSLNSTLVAALDPLLDDRYAPPVWLEGRVADDAAMAGEAAVVSIDVIRARVAEQWRPVRGRATLSIGGAAAAAAVGGWTRGRTIVAPVLLRRPQIWRNFGGPSEAWQRLRRPSDVTGSVKSAALVEIRRGGAASEAGAAIRRLVRREVDRFVGPLSRESAAVIVAILIGDRTSLDPDAVKRLQRAGTYHVIAISGGNIAIVLIGCMIALRAVLRSRRAIALVALLVVAGYGALVGDQASVNRAVAAAFVVLGLQAAGWCATAWRTFLLAAAAVVAIDPLTVIDAGAWLSFGATLGILVLARPISKRLSTREHPPGRARDALVALLSATLAAELALVPISAAVFSQVSIAGLLLNFIAIPAMAVVQFAGIAVVALGAIAPSAASIAAHIAHWGVIAILRSADLVNLLPLLAWQTPPVSLVWVAGYYGGGTVAILTSRRALRRAGITVAAVCLVVVAMPPIALAGSAPRAGWMRVTFLDVGQGDSILVQFPTGQSLLVDAGGSATGFDVGTRVVRPALWALGVRRLDWLAVTHGDIDHAGGALSIINELAPREVWEGIPVERNAAMQHARVAAHERGAAWMRLTEGHNFEAGSAAVEVLNPPMPDWERPVTRNDDSLVMRVSFGDVSVMLTGDISATVERELALATRPRLRILKAPHHGSRTSSSAALVGAWLPQAVVVSVGRGNTFGHPAPDVLARYAQFGIDVFRTDRDGAVSLETDGREVQVRTATGRAWRLTAAGR